MGQECRAQDVLPAGAGRDVPACPRLELGWGRTMFRTRPMHGIRFIEELGIVSNSKLVIPDWLLNLNLKCESFDFRAPDQAYKMTGVRMTSGPCPESEQPRRGWTPSRHLNNFKI